MQQYQQHQPYDCDDCDDCESTSSSSTHLYHPQIRRDSISSASIASATSTSNISYLHLHQSRSYQEYPSEEDEEDDAGNNNNSEENGDNNNNNDGFWDPTNKSVDALLANELNKLSFHERESINEEIHGIDVDRKYIMVAGAVEETPGMLNESFCNLGVELEKLRSLSNNGGSGAFAFAFDRSQKLFGSVPEQGTYLNTQEFRIMFLRCELFDCAKAAKRICLFADLVYELYGDELGDEALERRTYLTDLDENEMKVMRTGYTQILPGRDRAGRRIYSIFAFDDSKSNSIVLPIKTRLRIAIYSVMSLLEGDVETQRRGIVIIFMMHNIIRMDVTDFIFRGKAHGRGEAALPMRIGALHYCFPSEDSGGATSAKKGALAQIMMPIVLRISGGMKPHVRIHTGE